MITFFLERDVFPRSHASLKVAAEALGHRVVDWDDEWWNSRPPRFSDPVVFHGSLGNAARIRTECSWQPGAFCNVEQFRSSAWMPTARCWLLNSVWRILPLAEFVENSQQVLDELGCDHVFVRPDSALKPFSGRVLRRDAISLAAVDYGFYFDDENLAVVIAPGQQVEKEWRYVVVARSIVASSGYDPVGRTATHDSNGAADQLAQEIANRITPPDDAYVVDLCESNGRIRLVELNPFSGSDLYFCDPNPIVTALAALLN